VTVQTSLAGDYVTDVSDSDISMTVALESGRILTSDIVVTATGDEPNTQWLTNSGLLTDNQLLIDEYCRVKDTIVAAGDVAFMRTSQGVQRNPIWTNAIEQAKTAAALNIRMPIPQLHRLARETLAVS